MPSISAALARFARETRPDVIPPPTLRRARHLILDALGIAYASGRHDFAGKALRGIQSIAGKGDVPVIGMGARLPLRDAALINSILVHGLDFDDTHMEGVVHATASVWPAVMTTGWFEGASVSSMLAAYVVGIETTARLGMVAAAKMPPVGLHPTCLLGIFGCAIASGCLMGLDHEALVMAQGIALSMASGSLECHEEGAWSKRLHPGWAAQAGIAAAAMARHGFTGPRKAYEGRFGVYNAFLQRETITPEQLARATAGLGEVWETDNVAIKPFPAVHFAHACADAAIALRRQHSFRTTDVEHIEAWLPAGVIKTICEPIEAKRRPMNAYAAQFSLPYIAAASLVFGRFTLAELAPDALVNDEVLALAALVESRVDPESTYPRHFSGELRIRLKDGHLLAHREARNRGCPDRPISDEEIVAKFMDNVAARLSVAEAQGVCDAILSSDGSGDARPIIERICAGRPLES